MGLPDKIPCRDLATCRKMVVSIENSLGTKALRFFTTDILQNYEQQLLAAIQAVRKASIGREVHSQQAITSHIYTALDQLGLAIVQLQERGTNQQFHKYLRSCQTALQRALENW